MLQHLTSPNSIRTNIRPVSQHLDDERIIIYIDEAEQLNIKPRIGDALYIDILNYVRNTPLDKTFEVEFDDNMPDEYRILLTGGVYNRKISGNCGNGTIEQKYFKGLVSTLEYYVYAKLVKNNTDNLTRFGFVQKDEQYSSTTELKQRLVAEKDALVVADGYMAECIDYLISNQDNIPLFRHGRARNRLGIKLIKCE